MNIALGILASVLAGIAGSMGLGGGSVLLIYLTLFAGVAQLTAQGINLMFFIPTAALSVIIYQRRGVIRWREILPIIIAGVITTAVAGYALNFIKPILIKKIFGGFILILGIYNIFKKDSQNLDKGRDK